VRARLTLRHIAGLLAKRAAATKTFGGLGIEAGQHHKYR
jgi:hypothetical protein